MTYAGNLGRYSNIHLLVRRDRLFPSSAAVREHSRRYGSANVVCGPDDSANFAIVVGSVGLSAAVSPGDFPKVHTVTTVDVGRNGLAVALLDLLTDSGHATATKNGNAYCIPGTITGDAGYGVQMFSRSWPFVSKDVADWVVSARSNGTVIRRPLVASVKLAMYVGG